MIDRKEMREKTCCLTGHRAIRPELLTLAMEELEIQIHELVQWKGVRYFGVGGALGFDTLAAELLFSLRETCYPYVKVILVYPFEGYTSRWADEQKAKWTEMLPKYDKRVCVEKSPSKEAYLARNRHLVDNSRFCLSCCYNGQSGTGYTIDYAYKNGLEVINIPEVLRRKGKSH